MTARARRDVTPRYRSTAEFFTGNDVETLRTGRADTGGDERLAKAMRRVGSKAPVALRLAGELIDRGANVPIDEALAMEIEHLRTIFSTKDAYEGLSSLGRRPPCSKAAERTLRT